VYQDAGTAPTATLTVPPTPQYALVAGTSDGSQIIVRVTYVNPNGETTLSAGIIVTPTTTQQLQIFSPPGQSNATGYNVYASVNGLQNSTPVALGTPFTIPYPQSSFGVFPPVSNTATGAGTGGALVMQLYPAATIGQVNIYYRARPTLWANTSSTSWTNLDTSVQEAAVIFAVGRVLGYRGRADEWKAIWEPEYTSMVEDLKESVNRRTIPKSGRVRDVTDRAFPSSPFWMR
jgi:hypothetical protein